MAMRPRAYGAPAYSSTGFARFFDDIVTYGLEIIGLYYGTYRAQVISRDDPDGEEGTPDPLGRLTVHVPAVDGESTLTTRVAYPIVPLAGSGYGFKSLPPVGGYVYVEFERGSLELPMWKGGWWGDDDLPSDLQPADAHGWFTPGGHQILLDEQSGSEVIRIKHQDGTTRLELDSNGNIYVVNKTNSKLYLGNGADTANQRAVLGDTLKTILENMNDAITRITVTIPGAGTSGVPLNAAEFQTIKGRLETALSQVINLK